MRFLGALCVSAAIVIGSVAGAAAEGGSFFRDIVFDKNADRFEVRLGALSYDSGIFSPQEQTGVVINGEFLFPSPSFLEWLGSPRPYIGFDYAPKALQTDFIYAGFNWEAYVTKRIYLTGSLGGSLNNAPNLINPVGYKALGCRALFHLAAGVGFDVTDNVTVQLYADHFSNANTCARNSGQEAAGVRFGYRF